MIWLSTSDSSRRLGAGSPDQAWVSGWKRLAGISARGGLWSVECWTWWPSERLAYRFAAT